jgi:hypothetical protein
MDMFNYFFNFDGSGKRRKSYDFFEDYMEFLRLSLSQNNPFLSEDDNDKMSGEEKIEKGDGWERKTWSSADGTKTYVTYYSTSTEGMEELINRWNSEQSQSTKRQQKNELVVLKKKLELAVANEDYETAAKLRDQIKEFEKK